MSLFKNKNIKRDVVEERFQAMVNLISDLPRSDYRRLVEAMDLVYDGYQKVRNVKTAEEKAIEKAEKEIEDIEVLEKTITKEVQ